MSVRPAKRPDRVAFARLTLRGVLEVWYATESARHDA